MNLTFPDLCRRLLFVAGIVTTFLLAAFVVIQIIQPDLAPPINFRSRTHPQ